MSALALQFGKTGVEADQCEEVLVPALLDDAARFHHQDAVAGEHRCKPVRDHERGPLGHQTFERSLDQRLAFGVERGCRLVEEKEWSIAQDRTGNGEALALSARERDAALS